MLCLKRVKEAITGVILTLLQSALMGSISPQCIRYGGTISEAKFITVIYQMFK